MPPVGYESSLEAEVFVEALYAIGPPIEIIVEPIVVVEPPPVEPPPPPDPPSLAGLNRLYNLLLPLWADVDDKEDDLLYWFCEALTYPYSPLETIVRGDDDFGPFERAVNVLEAPLWILPWLASIIGEEWGGPSTEVLRSQIRERPRRLRGTVTAIRAAAKSTLTGTKNVVVVTRVGGNPNVMTVVTIPAETPSQDATFAQVLRVTPAWVQLSNIVGVANDYADVDADNVSYAALLATYGTYDNVLTNNPI